MKRRKEWDKRTRMTYFITYFANQKEAWVGPLKKLCFGKSCISSKWMWTIFVPGNNGDGLSLYLSLSLVWIVSSSNFKTQIFSEKNENIWIEFSAASYDSKSQKLTRERFSWKVNNNNTSYPRGRHSMYRFRYHFKNASNDTAIK